MTIILVMVHARVRKIFRNGGRAPALAVATAFVLTACGASGGTSGTATKGDCPTAPVSVVVSVDQWGDIVNRLAGDCGAVTTIFKSSSSDPHDYEPTPADIAEFTGAKLVVVNGLDYDPWAAKAVGTLDQKPTVVDAGKVAALHSGDNPHIWYRPDDVYALADIVTAKLKLLLPKGATYFEQRHTAWRASMRPYDAEIVKIKRVASGATFGATEGIFFYMAKALGLIDKTPRGYATATANESDPSPGDLNAFEHVLENGAVEVLIYNAQTEGAIPSQVRSTAKAASVPIVKVTESVPPGFSTFEAWQVSQLRDLARALAR